MQAYKRFSMSHSKMAAIVAYFISMHLRRQIQFTHSTLNYYSHRLCLHTSRGLHCTPVFNYFYKIKFINGICKNFL